MVNFDNVCSVWKLWTSTIKRCNNNPNWSSPRQITVPLGGGGGQPIPPSTEWIPFDFTITHGKLKTIHNRSRRVFEKFKADGVTFTISLDLLRRQTTTNRKCGYSVDPYGTIQLSTECIHFPIRRIPPQRDLFRLFHYTVLFPKLWMNCSNFNKKCFIVITWVHNLCAFLPLSSALGELCINPAFRHVTVHTNNPTFARSAFWSCTRNAPRLHSSTHMAISSPLNVSKPPQRLRFAFSFIGATLPCFRTSVFLAPSSLANPQETNAQIPVRNYVACFCFWVSADYAPPIQRGQTSLWPLWIPTKYIPPPGKCIIFPFRWTPPDRGTAPLLNHSITRAGDTQFRRSAPNLKDESLNFPILRKLWRTEFTAMRYETI